MINTKTVFLLSVLLMVGRVFAMQPPYRITQDPISHAFNYIPNQENQVRVHWARPGKYYSGMIDVSVLSQIARNGNGRINKGKHLMVLCTRQKVKMIS